ncbi:MAG: type III-A CRISPR-associated RAMP protein Csm3 [Syntrophales bacterium]|jgi:CRISPR-associated protein Csm3|nr:type III-A CRISPR-associated RAMP protein Csm3 [Syntrophales bacterium]
MNLKLTDIKEINGKIRLISGLHIGAGDTEMHIGGIDNTVVRHPHTKEPYIPGSSIKGKVRSLLEMKSGLMPLTRGEPLQARHLKIDLSDEQKQECLKILKIFGSSGADSEMLSELGPTRVSFSDCSLSNKSREERRSLFEIKSETAIDRIKGTAKSGSLRFIERVPADIEFDFSAYLKILGEEDGDLLDYLLNGLKLLEMDSLGGSGSRGYGRIEFVFADEIIREKFENVNPFENGG